MQRGSNSSPVKKRSRQLARPTSSRSRQGSSKRSSSRSISQLRASLPSDASSTKRSRPSSRTKKQRGQPGSPSQKKTSGSRSGTPKSRHRKSNPFSLSGLLPQTSSPKRGEDKKDLSRSYKQQPIRGPDTLTSSSSRSQITLDRAFSSGSTASLNPAAFSHTATFHQVLDRRASGSLALISSLHQQVPQTCSVPASSCSNPPVALPLLGQKSTSIDEGLSAASTDDESVLREQLQQQQNQSFVAPDSLLALETISEDEEKNDEHDAPTKKSPASSFPVLPIATEIARVPQSGTVTSLSPPPVSSLDGVVRRPPAPPPLPTLVKRAVTEEVGRESDPAAPIHSSLHPFPPPPVETNLPKVTLPSGIHPPAPPPLNLGNVCTSISETPAEPQQHFLVSPPISPVLKRQVAVPSSVMVPQVLPTALPLLSKSPLSKQLHQPVTASTSIPSFLRSSSTSINDVYDDSEDSYRFLAPRASANSLRSSLLFAGVPGGTPSSPAAPGTTYVPSNAATRRELITPLPVVSSSSEVQTMSPRQQELSQSFRNRIHSNDVSLNRSQISRRSIQRGKQRAGSSASISNSITPNQRSRSLLSNSSTRLRRGASPRSSRSRSRASSSADLLTFRVASVVLLFVSRLLKPVQRLRAKRHLEEYEAPRAAFVLQCWWRRCIQARRVRRLVAIQLLVPWMRLKLIHLRKTKEQSVLLLQRVFRGERVRSFHRLMYQYMKYNHALKVIRTYVMRQEAQKLLHYLQLRRDERIVVIQQYLQQCSRIIRMEQMEWTVLVQDAASALQIRPSVSVQDLTLSIAALTGVVISPMTSMPSAALPVIPTLSSLRSEIQSLQRWESADYLDASQQRHRAALDTGSGTDDTEGAAPRDGFILKAPLPAKEAVDRITDAPQSVGNTEVVSAFIQLLMRTEAIERMDLEREILTILHDVCEERALIGGLTVHNGKPIPPLFAPLLLGMRPKEIAYRAATLFQEEQSCRYHIIHEYEAVPLDCLKRPLLSLASEHRHRSLVHIAEQLPNPLPEMEAESFLFFQHPREAKPDSQQLTHSPSSDAALQKQLPDEASPVLTSPSTRSPTGNQPSTKQGRICVQLAIPTTSWTHEILSIGPQKCLYGPPIPLLRQATRPTAGRRIAGFHDKVSQGQPLAPLAPQRDLVRELSIRTISLDPHNGVQSNSNATGDVVSLNGEYISTRDRDMRTDAVHNRATQSMHRVASARIISPESQKRSDSPVIPDPTDDAQVQILDESDLLVPLPRSDLTNFDVVHSTTNSTGSETLFAANKGDDVLPKVNTQLSGFTSNSSSSSPSFSTATSVSKQQMPWGLRCVSTSQPSSPHPPTPPMRHRYIATDSPVAVGETEKSASQAAEPF